MVFTIKSDGWSVVYIKLNNVSDLVLRKMWMYLLLVISLSFSLTLADAPHRRVIRQATYGNVELFSHIQCMCI